MPRLDFWRSLGSSFPPREFGLISLTVAGNRAAIIFTCLCFIPITIQKNKGKIIIEPTIKLKHNTCIFNHLSTII